MNKDAAQFGARLKLRSVIDPAAAGGKQLVLFAFKRK
jgi:hypothetical protein